MTFVGALHCASVAFPSSASSVMQVHGWTCRPANTGPPMGWFVTVSLAARARLARATTRLGPFLRPVTRPLTCLPRRVASARVTLRPLTVTRSREAFFGSFTASRASPPLIRSARLDSVRISSGRFASAAAGSSTASTAVQAKWRRVGTVGNVPRSNG